MRKPVWAFALLAGGNSSRMGKDKATLVLPNNETLLRYICRRLSAFGGKKTILGAWGAEDGWSSYPDSSPDKGPAIALRNFVKQLDGVDFLIVLTVDMPLIDIALIRNLQNWILSRQKSSWCVNLGERMCAFPLVLSSDNFDSICRGKSAKISDLVKDADGLYFPSSMFPQEKLLNINHPHQWEQFCSDYFFV